MYDGRMRSIFLALFLVPLCTVLALVVCQTSLYSPRSDPYDGGRIIGVLILGAFVGLIGSITLGTVWSRSDRKFDERQARREQEREQGLEPSETEAQQTSSVDPRGEPSLGSGKVSVVMLFFVASLLGLIGGCMIANWLIISGAGASFVGSVVLLLFVAREPKTMESSPSES